MTDGESQTDEISALQSIFTEEEFKNNCENGVNRGQFYAFVTLPDGFIVVINDCREGDNKEEIRIRLKFLPPIKIFFTLPPDYPSQASPCFTISCLWLTKELLIKLCEELYRLWEENKGLEILFIWMQFLKEESLSFLGITDTLNLNLSRQEKGIEKEKCDSEVLKEAENSCESKQLLSVGSLSENSEICDNVGLVNVTRNNLELNGFSSPTNDDSSRDLPHTKFSGASGEFSGHSNNRRTYYNRRTHPQGHNLRSPGVGRTVDADTNLTQNKSHSSRGYHAKNNESSFDNQKRNVDRPSSESHESFRRYERRKPRFVDGSNEYKSNSSCYENNKHYKRHKSPVERKISDSSSKKVENCTNEFCKTEFTDKKDTVDNNLEGKRLFEKNRKYQRNYNDGKEKFAYTNDNKPKRMFKTDDYFSGSRCFYNNRYQARRGRYRRGQNSNTFSSEQDTKIGMLVDNLSISEEKGCVDNVLNNNEQNVNVCESVVEESALDKKVKCHIGQSQDFHKHFHLFLQNYNKDRIKMEFMKNVYTCNICFQDKLGVESTQFLPCEHVFCRQCVTGYFEVRIKDGAVHNIMCPERKCTSEAVPSQVRDMVGPELFARYDSILLATTLDTMCDIIYCPRSSCQYPATKEEGSKMARCPSCNYAFCVYCKMVYHGVEACRFKNEEKKVMFEEYQNADSEKKLLMEQKYGRKQLSSLMQTMMSEVWIDDNSKKCPHCNAAIEKSDGCNKMVCGKCNTFFCWLCEARLNPIVPYRHYQDPSSSCYNLLFEGMRTDNIDNFDYDDYDDDDDDDDDGW